MKTMSIRLKDDKIIECTKGESLLDALKKSETYLIASCGGKGTCGKCKVRLMQGRADVRGYGKLTAQERESGYVLACMAYPLEEMHIDIPQSSRLVVGDKIAFTKATELVGLLESFNADIVPLIHNISLHIPAPTIHDNISDIERLRRSLQEHGISNVRFSHSFTRSLAGLLRRHDWDVSLGYADGPEAIYIESAGDSPRTFGLAVDIGTTTVVAYLIDLQTGAPVDVGFTYNSQMRHGDDVITRIVYATEGGGLQELKDAIVEDINDLTTAMLKKHGINSEDVRAAAISGNTTMAHLFWGLDPGYIREEPYIPTLNSFPQWRAGTAGLAVSHQAPVYTLPCVASYVGGDIVAGVLASKMHRDAEITLFMDIGTNGEIAIGNNEWLVTAACSAGPCFEGSGIKHGMRATEGAIESVVIEPASLHPQIKTVGGARPAGICGSGMIDAISEMFLNGIIDQRGNFIPERAAGRLRHTEEGTEYVIFEDGRGAITLNEADIENILRAKAAIYAGVSLLLAEVGLTVDSVDRIYIAGGFGSYLNIERAIILGMLPDMPKDKFKYLGNTSISGAYLTLLSADLRREAEDIASKMTYIELSVSRGFMDEYMSSLFLPHTDMSKFPTVKSALDSRGKT